MSCSFFPGSMIVVGHYRHEIHFFWYSRHVVANVDHFSVSRYCCRQNQRWILLFEFSVKFLKSRGPKYSLLYSFHDFYLQKNYFKIFYSLLIAQRNFSYQSPVLYCNPTASIWDKTSRNAIPEIYIF